MKNKFDTQINLYLPYEAMLGREVIDFEVASVLFLNDEDVERIEEDEIKEGDTIIWSVYVRVKAGIDFNPVDCLADFPDKEAAYKFEDILRKLFLN